MSTDYVPPLTDLLFVLNEVLGYERLFSFDAFAHADPDIGRAVLTEAAHFATDVLAPLRGSGDAEGAHQEQGRVIMPSGYREAYRRFAQGGWPGLDMPREFGDQDLPLVLQTAFAELVNGACVAFGMLPLMARAAARLLIDSAHRELVAWLVPALVAGESAATICISEPGAGSDVGRIATRASPDSEGTYRISGTKIFITYGDHDLTERIIHLVLAKLPGAAAGTRGLSLFAVPVDRSAGNVAASGNTVQVIHVERKMGLKASPTCVVQFENARGHLVGAEHAGLAAMFTMMNAMRLEVAVQGVAVAGAATARALDYATQRLQGGAPHQDPVAIIRHADVRRMLLEMRARTEALRALVLETAFQLDLARAGSGAGRTDAMRLAEWLLPVCKACGSEAGFEVSSLAVQVFGGYGYVADSGIEQYVRDSRVMSIYEGTSGIQALDLVMRKLSADEGIRYRIFAGRIRDDLANLSGGEATKRIASALEEGLTRLDACTTAIRALLPHRSRDAQAGATAYLKMVGLVGSAWMWLRMAAAAEGSPLQTTKQALAEFHAQYLMPETAVLAERTLLGAALFDSLDDAHLASSD